MAKRLTENTVATLPPPPTSNRIYYDAPDRAGKGWTPGFGCQPVRDPEIFLFLR